MERAYLNPACLPPGTRVGPWRLVELHGLGTYGAVYLAEGVEPEATGRAALKLALSHHDERFAREVELLSRLHHPCVPGFLGQGHWLSPAGRLHPYFAMEWVEGLPLYDWAQASCPTSRQVLQLFAGLARALEATHAAGGVHRDVKGGNVLVRREDGRGFLVDFGAASYRGAPTLTRQPFPPGTPAYRSPESFRYSLHLLKARGPLIPYAPGPADDLFALGITAWRLVTGHYPPSPDPLDAQAHVWDLEKGKGPRPARALNARCCLELSSLIARMLSPRPEARGSARELAEALERAARRAGPEADARLFIPNAPRPGEGQHALPAPAARAHHRSRLPWLTVASLAAALAFAAVWGVHMHVWKSSSTEQAFKDGEERDGGTVGIGDAVLTAQQAAPHVPSVWSAIGLDLPSKPFPEQTRPDANGRCPYEPLVPINGGCWLPVGKDAKNCPPQAFAYKGKCYAPFLRLPSPPTSSPSDARDGGAQ